MTAPALDWRPLAGLVFLGRRVRIDLYATIGDLLDASFAIEEALAVCMQTARDQGKNQEAWVLSHWHRALVRGSFAEEIARWVPASEAMIFAAYGQVDANALFAGASRVADLRDRQTSAVRQALAMPALIFSAVLVMLWGAGGHFIPLFQEMLPADAWSPLSALFRDVSLWLYDFPHVLAAALVAAGIVLHQVLVRWTGPGRAALDRVAPFSIYRTVVGSAFLFVLLEYLRAGVDLNDRTFNELKRSASPYTRHRIASIQQRMSRGDRLGQAMMGCGHGFPDPALSPVVAALDGIPDWETKLGRFVDRWVRRSEATMRARSAALNGILVLAATVIIFGMLQALFEMMDVAGSAAGGRY